MTDQYGNSNSGSTPGRGDDWASPPPGGHGAPRGYSAGPSQPANAGRMVAIGVVVAGMLMAVCSGLLVFWGASGSSDFFRTQSHVQIINTFERPVEVQFGDDSRVEVPPRTMMAHGIDAGDYAITTTLIGGPLVEEFVFNVPERTDLIVYNIAGMAPAFLESVTYFDITSSAYHTSEDFEEDLEFIGGLRRFTRNNVAYINREPPEEIDMPLGQTRSVRWGFFYDTYGEDDLGVDITLALLSFYGDTQRFNEVLRTVVKFYPHEDWYHFWFWSVMEEAAYGNGNQGRQWIEYLQEIGRENLDALAVHQIYVEMSRAYAELLGVDLPEVYYQNLHEELDTVETAYLYSSVVPDREIGAALLERVLAEGSEFENVMAGAHRVYGEVQVSLHDDCSAALPHLERSAALDAYGLYGHIGYYVLCLVEAGRANDARAFLRNYINEFEVFDHHLAALYTRAKISQGDWSGPFEILELTQQFAHDEHAIALTRDQKLSFANETGFRIDESLLDVDSLSDWQRSLLTVNRVYYEYPHQLLATYGRNSAIAGGFYSEVRLLLILLAGIEGNEDLIHQLGDVYFEYMLDRQAIEDGTANFRFTGDAPREWARDDRAAYYVARAHIQSSDADKRRDLQLAMEQSPLWGPIDGIATAMLANLD